MSESFSGSIEYTTRIAEVWFSMDFERVENIELIILPKKKNMKTEKTKKEVIW